jgi:hypothetical protein
MTTRLATGLILIIAVAAGLARGMEAQERARTEASIQAISWDSWLVAKTKAEENDAAGNLVAALQYYLEYVRQAQGLNSPARVAWGKNNAAYMIIKMHRQDATVDLTPAEKLLEEGLAIPEASEDCRRVLSTNLEHVKLSLGRTP